MRLLASPLLSLALAFCVVFSWSFVSMRSAEAIEETEVVIELGGIGIDMEFDEVRQLLYITVPALNEVVFLSTLTYEIVDRVVVGSRPHGIDLSNDGSQLFVALNQAGSVVILDPDTSDITEVIVGDVVGDARVWDVIEGKENRVFVSANPSSSGLAYIGMIKLDEGNAVVRVASNRIIRARPVFEDSPDHRALYVGAGFSPNSLYKLDLEQPDAPIILEDQHGTVSGTDHLEVSPDGSRIYLASGQVLRTGSFIQAASIGAGVPRFGDSGNVVYVLDKFGVIGVYDTTTFLKVDEVNLPCSFASVKQLLVLPSGSGWLGLGDDLVCGLVRGVPTMTPFELERVSLSFEGPGMDEFRFSARFVLAESSDGIDPESEAVQVSFGNYTTVLPAGSFECKKYECSYKQNIPRFVEMKIRADYVDFRTEDVDLSNIANPVEISVSIGNDQGKAITRLRGRLKFEK